MSLALIDLGEVKKGTILGPDQLSTRQSGWLGGLGISDSALKAIEKMNITDGKPHDVMPVTLEGTIIETENGNKALLFIADVLSAGKSELAKTISSAVLPAERAKSAQEAADALEQKRQAEEQAYSEYLAALDAQAKTTDPSDSQKTISGFNVEKAKRAWCLKYSVLQKLGAEPTSRTCSQ